MTLSITVPLRGAVQQQVLRPAVPPVTGTFLFVDMSNWTGELTGQGCSDLKNAGYVGAIVQAVTGLDGKSYTRQQLTACVANGLRIHGYVWNSHTQSVASRLPMFDGFNLETIWLDVEAAGLTRDDVDRDLALIDGYLADGRKAPIYGAKWFWDQQGWTHQTWWADRLLWAAIYDGVADPDVGFVPFGGWQSCHAKQFAGTSSIGSVREIDLSIMRTESS